MHVNYLLQQLDVTMLLRYLSSAIVSSSGTIAPDMVLTRWDSHLEYVQQQLQHLKSAKMYLDKCKYSTPWTKIALWCNNDWHTECYHNTFWCCCYHTFL